MLELSSMPPTIAVLPSAESETEKPCQAPKDTLAATLPTRFGPCCTNWAIPTCDKQNSAREIRTEHENNLDDTILFSAMCFTPAANPAALCSRGTAQKGYEMVI